MVKIRVLRAYLLVLGVFTLFWWPLCHWFFSDWYHSLLGFGSFNRDISAIIGTIGMVPVLLIFFAAKNPVRNRDSLLVLILFALLMAGTYVYLIVFRDFPVLEYFNAGILVFNAAVLIVLFPEAPCEPGPGGDTCSEENSPWTL